MNDTECLISTLKENCEVCNNTDKGDKIGDACYLCYMNPKFFTVTNKDGGLFS